MGLPSDLSSFKNSKTFWSRSLESETLLLPRRLRFFSLPTLCWNKLSYWLSQSHFWSMWNSLAVFDTFLLFFFLLPGYNHQLQSYIVGVSSLWWRGLQLQVCSFVSFDNFEVNKNYHFWQFLTSIITDWDAKYCQKWQKSDWSSL